MSYTQTDHVHDIAFSGISRKREKVFFIQIGAADGKHADPIYPFVKRYGWNGILVEPLPDLFNLLQKNYNKQSGLAFENIAITGKKETRKLTRIPMDKVGQQGVPAWAFGASSLVPDKTRFATQNSPAELYHALNNAAIEVSVSCDSLQALLDRHGVASFDILQLDTEGYDASILKQLDFTRYKPMLINMEWQWLSEQEKLEVTQLLQGNGYSLYPSEADMLATITPIEQLRTMPDAPSGDSVPKYFPGIIGLVSNIEINEENAGCNASPARVDVVRKRGQQLAVTGVPGLLELLTSIDGYKSCMELATQIGCSNQQVLSWVVNLQKKFVLD